MFDQFSRHFRQFGTTFFLFLTKFCLTPHFLFWEGGGSGYFFLKKLFICVILILYTEFQSPTMPGTCQKVCGGGGG